MSLGTLRVLLGLDAAEFTTGLTKAEARLKKTEQQAQSFSRTLQKDIAFGVGKAVAALGTLDRVGGFLIRFGFDAINAAASFEDLGEKTGGSAEKLASFQTAADITKTSMESVGDALVKLTKGLAGADEETKGAANAVQKLGFNLAEFKELDSATQFEQLAKRLNEFADSNTKTSAAVQLFGKAGANQLSLMKELANQTDRSTILTKAHIKTADDFADKQAKVTSELKQYAGVVGIAVLPALTELSKAFVDVVKSMTSVDKQTGTLKASNAVRDWAETAAIAVATLAESLFALGKLLVAIGGSFRAVGADIALPLELITAAKKALVTQDLSGIKAVLNERNRIVEEANQRYVDLWNFNGTAVSDALRKNFALQRELEGDSAGDQVSRRFNRTVTKPKLPDWFGGGKSDKATKASQEAKKLLDKQLSDIDNFIKAEKRIFETRESDLARLYQNDQISISAYFDERLAALDRNTTATVELYDKQIKAQEAFAAAAKRRKDEPAAIDAQKQIGDIQAKVADVLHEKQQRALKIEDDRKQSARDYADQVAELQARLLDLLGTEEAAGKAALIRFDIQNRALLNRARAEGDKGTEQAISQLRTQADSQAKINVLLQDASVIEQNLATAQAKLHLERDLGLRGEVESLDLLGKSSGEAAAKLQIIADKYLAIAKADGTPLLIANAEAFKQKINEMAAATDILAAKIRQTFVDTGASAIETFLNSVAEGKSVLDSFASAFTQFANDIIRQINRIAAQKIADSLFKSGSGGDGGVFGGIADAFVSFIGGLSRQEKGGPVSGRTPYIVGERGPEIFVPRTVAAEATRQIDSLIAQTGKPAEYTDRVKAATVATNLPHLIGAKGPEIFVPKVAGIVIPNNKVAKLSAVLERKVPAAAIARRRESAPLIAARTILRDEKIITRYANAPYSRRASGGPVAAHVPYIVGERGREIFIPKSANAAVQRDEAISKLSKAFQKQGHSGPAATAQATRIINERQIYIQKSATAILRSKQAVAELVANAPRQRRAGGGPVTAHTPYVVGELGPELFMPKSAERIIKSERVHNDLVSNTRNEKTINQLVSNIQRKTFASHQTNLYDLVTNTQHSGGPVQARQTYIVGEPELFVTRSAEKIIKNENLVSELVTNNARRNEKVINDLVSKTVHHRESAAPNVAAKIIKNESRINKLISNNVQRDEEIINRLVTTTRREGGRSNLLIVGAHGPELFIPKAAGNIIKNERRINELVSNIEHRNIDRSSEKTIDEIISSTVQRRAKGGPIAAYRTRLVGERSSERFIGSETNITNNNGVSVPVDFFSNISYRRAMGGSVAANQPYIVGEKGPEMFVPKTAGQIVTNNRIAGGNEINISFVLPPGEVTRTTQNQIAAAAARGIAMANRRLN